MKNQDKLCDALGMVDEAIVQDAVLQSMVSVREGGNPRGILRRRLALLASACLALALLAGALLAVPLLTADEPMDTQPPALTETEGVGSPYEDAPLAFLSQLSEGQSTVVSDPALPSKAMPDDNAHPEVVELGAITYYLMYFDCMPGETVEVSADADCLRCINLVDDDSFAFRTEIFYAQDIECGSFLNIDPSTSCIQIDMPFETDHMDDVILEYTIYDGEKRVTGIGSMLVASRYPQAEEETALTPIMFSVTRSAALGSVRFTDPDAVTGEQVQALFEEFQAKADETKASLDFTPKTPYEVKLKAEVEIRRQFVDRRVGLGSSNSSWMDFSIFRVKVYAENGIDLEKEHRYVIMNDGSWFEIQFHQGCHSTCHMDELCPNSTGGDHSNHNLTVGCHVLAVDGRVFEVQEYTAEDGSYREKLVLIQG